MCEYDAAGTMTKQCPCHKPESHLAVRNLRRNLASLSAAHSNHDVEKIHKYAELSVEWRDRVNKINGVRPVPEAETSPAVPAESYDDRDTTHLRKSWSTHSHSPHVQRHIEDLLWSQQAAEPNPDIDMGINNREPLTNPGLLRPGLNEEQLHRRNFERFVFTRAINAESDCHSVMWNDATLEAMDSAYTRDSTRPGVPEANLDRLLTDQTLLDRHGSDVFKHWVRAHGGVITYPQYRKAIEAPLAAV